MRIAVISDLHLGKGDSVDQFRHDDYEFVRFLKCLEKEFEKIILLGDIYETLTSRFLGRAKEALMACQNAHKEIVERFNRKSYVYIHGNHDLVAAKILKAPEEMIFEDNQRILFRHGHQYDELIKKAKIVSEVGAWFGGWLIRLGISAIHDRISLAGEEAGLHEQFAVQSAHEKEVDIIVTGHTHVAAKSENGNKLYMNSGTCSKGRFQFLFLDTKTQEYEKNIKW